MVNQKSEQPNPILFFIKWLILIPLILFLVFFGGCLPPVMIADSASGVVIGALAAVGAFILLVKYALKKAPHKEIIIGLLLFYGFILLMFIFSVL